MKELGESVPETQTAGTAVPPPSGMVRSTARQVWANSNGYVFKW